MPSIWERESFYFHTDLLIVGAGLTGLLSSIYLKQKRPKLKVRILEKGLYPVGASSKNAGFACFGSISEIIDDINNEGESLAFDRVVKRYEGLKKLIELTKDADIGLKSNGAYEVFDSSEQDLQYDCLNAISFINQRLHSELGSNTFEASSNNFGMKVLKDSIYTSKESGLNSGKLLKALIKKALSLGVELNFGCEVLNHHYTGSYWEVETKEVSIKSDKVLLATNGFTQALLDKPIVPGRGQLLLTKPIPELKLKGNFHLHKGYFYFRDLNGRLLLGGGRHLDRANESTTDQNTTETIQAHLRELLHSIIIPDQKVEIDYSWAGTMAFGPSNEKETLIEKMDKGLYLGARFGGMGVALSSKEADRISDMILVDS